MTKLKQTDKWRNNDQQSITHKTNDWAHELHYIPGHNLVNIILVYTTVVFLVLTTRWYVMNEEMTGLRLQLTLKIEIISFVEMFRS
jgi:hypothetical protein